ncbi:MAG: hypothetical protein EOM40_12655 [Clostridia bacterium]|nr:hypothetical protein [Clostridia bacterium]
MNIENVQKQKSEWKRKGWSIPEFRGKKQDWFSIALELVEILNNNSVADLSSSPNLSASDTIYPWRVYKIDAFGVGMREANQKIANTFRTFADKPEVDYSKKEKKISKTELFKKPWLAKKKILDSMELRLDAAIDKVENLSMDVQIDKMEQTYKEIREKAHQKSTEQEQAPAAFALVAETEAQYGSEAFEAHQNTKGNAGVEANLTESSKIIGAEKGEKCR